MATLASARRAALVAALLTALPLTASAASAFRDDAGEDQFVVRFKPRTSEAHHAVARDALLEELGRAQGVRLRHVRRMSFEADVIHVDRPLGKGEVQALLRRLRDDPRVELAQVDHRAHPASSDPRWGEQWHFGGGTGINLEPAQARSRGKGIVVAVLDTGIVPHPDLGANILTSLGYDFISDLNNGDTNGRDASPIDTGDGHAAGECLGSSGESGPSWHGTHVTGIIAAATDNNIGVAGVAPEADVLPVRVLGRCGGRASDIADAIVWSVGMPIANVRANTRRADVINLSLGWPASCDALTQLAINSAVTRGAVVVVAAGNDTLDVGGAAPASCENVITVAASDSWGKRAPYSNFGARVDLTAPGGYAAGILSTVNKAPGDPDEMYYATKIGTSQATPQVAGTVALMQAIRRHTPAEVERILKLTTRPPAYCPQKCGDGMLDADRATRGAYPFLYLADYLGLRETDTTKGHLVSLRLSEPVAQDVSFDVNTESQAATEGTDYEGVHLNGLVIPAGSTTKSFTLLVTGDDEVEYDENFHLNTTNVTVVPMLHPVTDVYIPNDDGVSAWIENAEATEGNDLRFAIRLSQALPTDEYFRVWVHPGSADATDIEYGSLSGSIPANTTSYDFVVKAVADTKPDELDETFDVHLDALATAIAFHPINDFEAVGTILATEKPKLSVGNANIVEGDTGQRTAEFTATLTRPSTTQVSLTLSTSNGTAIAGTDYVQKAQTLAIPPGSLSATFSVALTGDTEPELHQTFYANLVGLSTNALAANLRGVGTILNDDSRLLWVDDAQLVEKDDGSQAMRFLVHLSQESTEAVSYVIGTSNGSARAGTQAEGGDYQARTGVADSIPAGAMEKAFEVLVWGDAVTEPNERFFVTLSAPVGAVIHDTDGVADGVITNDDGPTLTIADGSVLEGAAGTTTPMTFRIELSGARTVPVSFSVVSVSNKAVSDDDFEPLPKTTITLQPGQTSATATVMVKGDATLEANEAMYVTLGDEVGATLRRKQAQGTILNDEGPYVILDDAAPTIEGDSGEKVLVFVARVINPGKDPVKFYAVTADGDATVADGDYVGLAPRGFWIPGGMTSKVIGVKAIGDTRTETDEAFRLSLGDVRGATVARGEASGVLLDDDTALSIGDVTVSEAAGTATFTVKLSGPARSEVKFNIGTVANTATSEVDYSRRSLIAQTIAAGQKSFDFPVTIRQDQLPEGAEAFFVSVSNVTGAKVADANARGTIVDDD